MTFLNKLVKKITGKNDINIQNINLGYIFFKGTEFFMGILRGTIQKLFLKKSGKRFFLGKRAKLLYKKKIILGDNVRIYDNSYIDALSHEGIHLSNNIKIGSYSKIICSGTISNLGKGIVIDENSSFSEYTFFGAAGGITIGKNVISGQSVRFHAENHNYEDTDVLIKDQGVSHQGIIIGNDVWIGSGVVFLDGTVIGDGCVIAANAVVRGVFQDNVVIGGMPAKVLKKRGN